MVRAPERGQGHVYSQSLVDEVVGEIQRRSRIVMRLLVMVGYMRDGLILDYYYLMKNVILIPLLCKTRLCIMNLYSLYDATEKKQEICVTSKEKR